MEPDKTGSVNFLALLKDYWGQRKKGNELRILFACVLIRPQISKLL